jgi:hypothetical protein
MPIQIEFANSDQEITQCFSVMVQLRPHLTQSEFINRVKQQQQSGYFLVYLAEKDNIKALAGFRFLEKLSSGKILYVDDLVTDIYQRSAGYGAALWDWLVNYAQTQNCAAIHLDSGLQRAQAHRFYFRQRMQIIGFHFALSLDKNLSV